MEVNRVLYNLNSCSECRIVRERLDKLKLTYGCVNVDPIREKRDMVYAASGQYSVPVFVDCNKVFTSVDSILTYLAETYGSADKEVCG